MDEPMNFDGFKVEFPNLFVIKSNTCQQFLFGPFDQRFNERKLYYNFRRKYIKAKGPFRYEPGHCPTMLTVKRSAM